MPPTRWTDAFLDTLRTQGDSLADEHLQKLVADNEIANIRKVFAEMDSNNEIPPASTFPELSQFFAETNALPPHLDTKRINRGEMVFQKNAFTGALVLLTKSLPEGYAAPNLSIILNLSGNLRTHPYKRLLSTLQTVVNVSTFHGFQPGGRAVITAQKLRLLHSGIRHVTRRYRPAFESQYGIPVNQEDMLGTVMGFSYLVIEGMRTLDVGLTHDEEEDFFYIWRMFALMMGIHPPGKPDSFEYIPDNVDDARAFYEAYRRRHYVAADKNPDGVALGAANLRMLVDFVPWIFRLLGFGRLPHAYMQKLMGTEQCARIGIQRRHFDALISWVLLRLQRLWKPFERIRTNRHERFGGMIFQDLIDRAYGGEVTFTVPMDLSQMKNMINERDGHSAPQREQVPVPAPRPGE
ncbi:MAG: oxygenase MpaB family protein [Bacteroidota bacterium]|jgi:hypothetical protein